MLLSNVEFTMIPYQEITAIPLFEWLNNMAADFYNHLGNISPIAIVTNIEIHTPWVEFNLILRMEIET